MHAWCYWAAWLRQGRCGEVIEGGGVVGGGDEGREEVEKKPGHEAARSNGLVTLVGEGEKLETAILVGPEPDFAHAEAFVNWQLVEAPARDHDLDGNVGIAIEVGADAVALVRIQAALFELAAERRRALAVPRRVGPQGGRLPP